MAQPLQVAILIFDEVEVLDFAGPFEVFSVATRVALRDGDHREPPFDVGLCAKTLAPVRARHGLTVIPELTLEQAPRPDVLIVPGGVVARVCDDSTVTRWISDAHRTSFVTASVCTGAFLLARAGLLEGKRVTTHWEDIEDLRAAAPGSAVVDGVRYVDEGRVVTSAGVAAGVEASLHLVRRLTTASLAIRTARQIDVPFEG